MYIQTSLHILHLAHQCVAFSNYISTEIAIFELRALRVMSVGLEIASHYSDDMQGSNAVL